MNSSLIKTEIDFKNIQKKNLDSTNNKMYQIASCSKFITYIVVGKLYELGKLDYDTDINKYLKNYYFLIIQLFFFSFHFILVNDFNGGQGIPNKD